jgi:hypothetical protein
MCTMIAQRVELTGADRGCGSAKGPDGWFEVGQLYVGYDHPVHVDLEHALSLDFVNEERGPGSRVAVELSLAAARQLRDVLDAAIAAADIYEAG